jgi:hypothetical protein
MLQGITALIVIDNLESAQGSEVIRLYDSLPSSVSYLFTSRLGIGEIERRYPLGPLASTHAIQLFRKFASRRYQGQLAALSQSTLEKVVLEHLRSSPLAIRWYILSVETGKEPASTLRDQSELLDFCVRNVYEALSPETRNVLSMLNSLDHSVSFSELAVLAEQSIDDLRKAIQELSRGSLVVHETDPSGGLASRISVSPTARMFLPGQANGSSTSTEIMRREQEYLRAVERRRAEEADRLLGPNVVRVRGPRRRAGCTLASYGIISEQERGYKAVSALRGARTGAQSRLLGVRPGRRIHRFDATTERAGRLALPIRACQS